MYHSESIMSPRSFALLSRTSWNLADVAYTRRGGELDSVSLRIEGKALFRKAIGRITVWRDTVNVTCGNCQYLTPRPRVAFTWSRSQHAFLLLRDVVLPGMVVRDLEFGFAITDPPVREAFNVVAESLLACRVLYEQEAEPCNVLATDDVWNVPVDGSCEIRRLGDVATTA